MLNWKLYEDYKEQDRKALELTERYAKKVKDAKEGVTAAVVAYEDVLKKEFAGESVATQKKKALSDIDKARTALQVAEEEAKQANEYAEQELQGTISRVELANDWNENIEPAIRKERLVPIVEKAHKGLKEYYSALADFYKLNDEFSGLLSELQEIERSAWRAGEKRMYTYTDIAQLGDIPKPSDDDLMQVYRTRDLPDAYKEEN
ncbi:hypothetical protein CON65_16560 [Bacillus pseudomycoides]|uniref:Uncharacterized protein n=1 Tax=Bacillus pseudomycoides TaxID=64104 RepID=A0AA91ZSP4_9BACI|nr:MULTISPECIES: hypothetical protein [Bacillus]PEB54190.1 hypothetical protein COO03_06085 [Bacillus sp. AFS098217]PED81552.1 hypothetical protein CON65_16560 [Bacillus pseudomycoides]PEU14128.1 hypothetical protein CN525_18715 [Bacillus sp. AFS014408]PEU17397.1 hypothetical protein CN524_02425 [Bacillus sp. AFS019443]PFW62995.1 hypothetical protein COL20_10515 [Bacillus sp. AFS075034]